MDANNGGSRTASNPLLVPYHIFGLKGDVRNNIQYIDENVVAYPCGHSTVLYNTETKEQQFIHGVADEGITSLAVTTNKKFVAVAERTLERGVVNIYDAVTLRRRKMLNFSELGSNEITTIAFSADNKFCLTQGGAPEWTLVLWAAEKSPKVVCSVKTSTQGAVIHQADFSPGDSNICCVSGDGILKFFRVSDNQFKPIPTSLKRDPQNFLCHAWLSDDRVVVATDTGELLIIVDYEFRLVLQSSPSDGCEINSIIATQKGFVCGGEHGVMRIYERSDDSREYYKCTKRFQVLGNPYRITNLAVSPSEDWLACTLENHQIYNFSLSNTEILKEESMNFDLLSTSFHAPGYSGSAAVTGLDTCVRKPLVVTCGLDKTVRIWNYQERTMELMKEFSEEAHSVAFHPSGLHVLVGFTDKLRLMNLLMDDIRPMKDFGIKSCRECSFSNGGQYFAVVNGTTIQVFATFSCDLVANLRGHSGKVRSLYWRADDKRLLSAAMDGSVFLWNLQSQTKEQEFMQPRCNFSCVVASADVGRVFAVGSDQMLKEIELNASAVRSEVSLNLPLGQLALTSSHRVLFAGSSEPQHPGSIRAFNVASQIQDDPSNFPCHSGPVTRVRLSPDNQFLFSCAEDGSLCIFEVHEREGGRGPRGRGDREGAVTFAEEILVTKSDLQEKTAKMQQLKSKVEELSLNNEYQLRLKDMNYKEKIKDVSDKFTAELEQDRKRYEELRDEKKNMELEYEEKLRELEEKHSSELHELEGQYKGKINSEVNRYQQLVQERDEQNRKWDEENQALVESHTGYLQGLTEDYDKKVGAEQGQQTVLADVKDDMIQEFNEAKNNIEEDADVEIEEIKQKYEAKLSAEREATLRLKGENGIMKKKFSALTKDIEDQREEIRSLHEREKELYENIKGLEKDIQGHKKEIREREETIADKEKRIYDLKKKNQELEKFKFVLDYKIKELKRQIEPRENEIADMRQQIEEMDQELEQYHKSNAALDLMIGELRLKMDGMQKEITEQRGLINDGNALIRRFRSDIHQCVQHIHHHKQLKDSIVALYKKYVMQQFTDSQSTASNKHGGGEVDVQREYNRQREYLEKSVESLKRNLSKDMEMHRNDNMRLMRENVALTNEINELRREARGVHLQHCSLENQLQAQQSQSESSAMGMQYLPQDMAQKGAEDGGGAIHTQVDGGDGPGGEITDDGIWQEIQGQQETMMQLQQHIDRLHQAMGVPVQQNSGLIP